MGNRTHLFLQLIVAFLCFVRFSSYAQTGAWDTNKLTWTYGGAALWASQTNITYDGGTALQSGAMTNFADSYVETQISGPVKLQFWWKTSSYTNFDRLSLLVNGLSKASISGETAWSQQSIYLGTGPQTVRWSFHRTSASLSAGSNAAWIDAIGLIQPATPEIVATPVPRSVLLGGYTTLSYNIFGAAPMYYQWRLNGADIVGATNDSSITLTNIQASLVGTYSLVVSNEYGSAVSPGVDVRLQEIPGSSAMSVLWSKGVGSTPWLAADTNNSTPWRGIAYNKTTGHVLVSSRAAGTNIWVLDAESGQELYALNLSGLRSERFPVNCVRVADDGAVYACNLRVTSDSGNVWRIYKWQDDSSNSVPELVWSGDPFPGQQLSLGDSFDVQGSGASTRFITSPYGGYPSSISYACIVTPANGTNSAAVVLKLPSFSQNGPCYVSFGLGNTFWQKDAFSALRYFSYSGTNATLLATCNTVGSTFHGMDVDPVAGKFAAILNSTPQSLQFFTVRGATNGQSAVDFEFFQWPLDLPNSAHVGSVDMAGGRLYAIDANNGILAMKYADDVRFTVNPDHSTTLSWAFGTLQSSATIQGPFEDVPDAVSPYTTIPESPQLFYRLRN